MFRKRIRWGWYEGMHGRCIRVAVYQGCGTCIVCLGMINDHPSSVTDVPPGYHNVIRPCPAMGSYLTRPAIAPAAGASSAWPARFLVCCRYPLQKHQPCIAYVLWCCCYCYCYCTQITHRRDLFVIPCSCSGRPGDHQERYQRVG